MIIDGVSYSAFIHILCRVILSHMVNPTTTTTVVSLQPDPFWSRRVPLIDTYVSRRLLTPVVFVVFPNTFFFNVTLLIQYVLHHLSKTLSPSLWRGCIKTH